MKNPILKEVTLFEKTNTQPLIKKKSTLGEK